MPARSPTAGPDPAADGGADPGGDLTARIPGPPASRIRRRRKALTVTAAATAAVLLAGGADLLLEHTARQRIVAAAACRLGPAGAVSARLSGSLAGLRLLTGDVGTVRIDARDVRRDGASMSVAAELYGVTTKGRSRGGRATATIPYEQLARRLGGGIAGLRPGPDGSGGLAMTGTLAGIPLPVTVHAAISVGDGKVTVTPTNVAILGEVFGVDRLGQSPQTAALTGRLAPRKVTVPQLPSGVALVRAATAPDGLRLSLSISGSGVAHASKGCTS